MAEPWITRLKVVNFRSYEEAEIRFGLRTRIEPLYGHDPNDIGKTNLLRALKIVCHHLPFPKRMLRWGCDTGLLEVEAADGTIVQRGWNKGSQYSTIKRPGQEPISLNGMKDAEGMVRSALRFKKVALSEEREALDLNFMPVNAPPLLIGDTPAAALRKVSGLMGGQTIEDAGIRLKSKAASLNSEASALESELASCLGRLGQLEPKAGELEAALAAADAAYAAHQSAALGLAAALADSARLDGAKRAAGRFDPSAAKEARSHAERLLETVASLDAALGAQARVQDARTRASASEDALEQARTRHGAAEAALREELERLGTCPLCGASTKDHRCDP